MHNYYINIDNLYVYSDEVAQELHVLLDFFWIIVYNNDIRMIEPKDQRK